MPAGVWLCILLRVSSRVCEAMCTGLRAAWSCPGLLSERLCSWPLQEVLLSGPGLGLLPLGCPTPLWSSVGLGRGSNSLSHVGEGLPPQEEAGYLVSA